MHRKCNDAARSFQSDERDSNQETPDSTDAIKTRGSPDPRVDVELGLNPDPRTDSINALRAKAQEHSAKLFRTFSTGTDTEKWFYTIRNNFFLVVQCFRRYLVAAMTQCQLEHQTRIDIWEEETELSSVLLVTQWICHIIYSMSLIYAEKNSIWLKNIPRNFLRLSRLRQNIHVKLL